MMKKHIIYFLMFFLLVLVLALAHKTYIDEDIAEFALVRIGDTQCCGNFSYEETSKTPPSLGRCH